MSRLHEFENNKEIRVYHFSAKSGGKLSATEIIEKKSRRLYQKEMKGKKKKITTK
jgi:hypothetical protein